MARHSRPSLLVRGLGAAMQGYGKTLLEQDADRRKAVDNEALLMREQALAQFQHGLQVDTVNATAAANVGMHLAESNIDTAAEADRLPGRTQAKIDAAAAEIRARYAADYDLLTAKQRGDMTKEQYIQAQMTHRTQIEQAGQNSRAAAQNQVTLDTHPILTGVAADGTPTAAFAPGATTRNVKIEGARPTTTYNMENKPDDSLDSYRQGGGSTDGSTAAAPAAAPAAGGDRYGTFNQMLAEAAMHPAFKGLSADQVRSQVIALAKRQNIPAPDQ